MWVAGCELVASREGRSLTQGACVESLAADDPEVLDACADCYRLATDQ